MSKTRRQVKRALEVTESISKDLEVVRNEERLGGVVSQKENEELFFIDTRGKDAPTSIASSKPCTVKKGLKIDQILKPESSYTIGRSHQVRGSKAEETLIAKKTKFMAGSKGNKTSKVSASAQPSVYDAWADEEESSASATKQVRFTPNIPAVPVPNPAVSYNPSREDHLVHLESLELEEIGRLARNEEFRNRLPRQEVTPESVATYDLVSVANRKLALGQFSDDEEEGEGGLFFSEGASSKASRKKTIQDRKRQLRHKKLLLDQTARRQEKILLNSIESTPSLLAQLQVVKETRKATDELLAPLEKEMKHSRKLSKIKNRLVMEPLNVKFPEELPTSMRQLAPEGNLITDRFRNLIERGCIEATTHKILSTETKTNNIRQGRSLKPRIKMVEKFSYKDFK